MIYYMCKYTPLEIFAGFGQKCERLEAVADSFDAADSAAHPNICGYGKSLLEACSSPMVTEIVLINCCDVGRRIYDILKNDPEKKFVYLLDLPHKRGKPERWLFEMLIRKITRSYEEYSGIPFDFRRAWNALLEQSGNVIPEENRERPYISLQGAHGGQGLLQTVRAHFAVPVYDDTCSGNRHLGITEEPEDEDAFFTAYSRILLGQFPCMRMKDISSREALGRHAEGIIYHTMKFCDYYGFEYAEKRKTVQPILKIETDATRLAQGQLSTRLDAFAESLHAEEKENFGKDMKKTGYVAGVDSGSASTDVVIMDRNRNIKACVINRTGAGAASGADRTFQEALDRAGLKREDVGRIISTGYGRETIGLGDESVTEITCHAKGAHFLKPEVRTIIDIGGQDSKVIRVDENGAVTNFVMNDKCAAGTGRFMEMMARTMELTMDQMDAYGRRWKNDVTISNMCTVFAESEVVSLIAANTPAADIIHGLNKSVAGKTASLVKRVRGQEVYMMTGGVARNEGIVLELEKRLGAKIYVSEYAQVCGAIGAALIALEDSE